MRLGPGRMGVFLPALYSPPVRMRHFLMDDFLFLAADFQFRGRNQGRVNHLSAAGDKAFLEDLFGNCLEQRKGSRFPSPILKSRNGGAIRNVQRLNQTVL